MARLLLSAIIFLASASSAYAGFDAGVAAYQRGDFETAIKEFEPAAEAGDATAQFTLGYMHQFGQGVAQDLDKAARWYRRAAEQGHPAAQYNLGVFHQDGQGAPRDDVAAYMWLDLAARAGQMFAGAARNALARRMSAENIAEAQRRVREWRPRAP